MLDGGIRRMTATSMLSRGGRTSGEMSPGCDLYHIRCLCASLLIGWHRPYVSPPPLVVDIYPKVQPPQFSSFQEEEDLTLCSLPCCWLSAFFNVATLQKGREKIDSSACQPKHVFYVVYGRPDQLSIPVWDQKTWTGQWAVGPGCGAFWRCFAALLSHKR